MTWPCRAIISEFDCWYRYCQFDPAQYFCGGWSWNIFYRHSPFSDSRRDIVSYKQKRVHKVLPSLSLPRKSVFSLTDHLDMAMTID